MEYCNKKYFQTIVHSGGNYGNRTIKYLSSLVWRAYEIRKLCLAVLIEDNTSSDLVEEWYNEALVEAAKRDKEFELDPPDKFT